MTESNTYTSEESSGSGANTGTSTTVVYRKPKQRRFSSLSTKTHHPDRDLLSVNQGKRSHHDLSHYKPMHKQLAVSILSPEPSKQLPSFSGFQNLAMIILMIGNVRLIIENYQNYGFLKTIITLGLTRDDAYLAGMLTATVPIHLFVALLIEKMAASRLPRRPTLKYLWRLFALLHSLNVLLALAITTYTVYFYMYNPMVGTICECHAIVLCLKVASYAFTNRDLRDSFVDKTEVPELYSTCPYPKNLTLQNLVYFWWAPTLVYQPVYPRTSRIRKGFAFRRVLEMALSAVLIWFLSSQYATPILEKSLVHFQNKSILRIAERLMKLSTISIAIWLLGFFLIFQSYLNFLAEILRFGDRQFYEDFWNCGSVGAYWKMWNKPMHNYFIRHFYIPLVKRGWKNIYASIGVFILSAILHEIVVGIPTHNMIGVAFVCMLLQVPLVAATAPLEKMGSTGHNIGNCVFWFSFFLGQPTAVLLYYFAWNLKFGSLAQY